VKTEKLRYNIKELRNLRSDKEQVLQQKTSEKFKLKNEQSEVRSQIRNLRQKEQQLRREIEQNKAVVDRLEKEIEQIIAEERKRTNLWKDLSPRQREISEAFEKNKGTLPWPVTDGIITQGFGENSHPVLDNIKLYNNGVDISTTKNSQVRCIWEGEARKVVSIPGANLTVIVRHGNYLSVYSNLVDVDVKPGDLLSRGEVIGEVYNDRSNSENRLHLEIYRENQKLNPADWLK
jgi:septal ring factor EnvC (AmiA/AmiB activator)